MLRMEEAIRLPIGAVRSKANFVVLDADLVLVSEHPTSEDACDALAKFFIRSNYADGLILQRTDGGWVEM
jgi:hypothetical protein